MLTINLRQDGNTSFYNDLNFDEWKYESSSCYFNDVLERIDMFHGQGTIGGHNKIYHSVPNLLDDIFIFKYSVQQNILDHFINEGQELYKQYENTGKPENWWKKEL